MGQAAAPRLKATLDEAMQRLGTYPEAGRTRDDLVPGLRFLPVEAHVIFYQVGEREVTIVRVLHGHQDAEAHLAP